MALVRMFERVGLKKKMGKTNAVVCTPEFIWYKEVEVSYKRRSTVEVDTFR